MIRYLRLGQARNNNTRVTCGRHVLDNSFDIDALIDF